LRSGLDDALLCSFRPWQNNQIDEQRYHHEERCQNRRCLGKEIRCPPHAKHRPEVARAERARKTAPLARLHQDDDHEEDTDQDFDCYEERVHKPSSMTYKNPNYFGVHIKDTAKADKMQGNSCFSFLPLACRLEQPDLRIQVNSLLVVPVRIKIPLISKPVPIADKFLPLASL